MGGYATRMDTGQIYATNPRKISSRLFSPLHSVFDNSDDTKSIHRIAVKHELSERKYLKKLQEEHGGISQGLDHVMKRNGTVKIGPFNIPTSAHASLGVMADESNNVRIMKNEKIKDRMQRLRYATGEKEVMKKITGKRYGIDHFTPEDIEKLHKASQTTPSFHAKSKTIIGRVIGAAGGAALVKRKGEHDDTIGLRRTGAGIGGAIAGGYAEKAIRTRLLKLHKV
jgi:hypothetical protein